MICVIGLEKALENASADPEAITQAVEKFYQQRKIESPGLVPADFARIACDL